MLTQIRLLLLFVTLSYLVFLGPSRASGQAAVHKKNARIHKKVVHRLQRSAEQRRSSEERRVVRFARRFLGIRYEWGGSSPRTGFDCSGFVAYVYDHFGAKLPHSSYEQFQRGKRVARRNLRPGDIVFFDDVGHVGLYIGKGRFIHAPHTGTRVSISSMITDPWYRERFVGARRLAVTMTHHVSHHAGRRLRPASVH